MPRNNVSDPITDQEIAFAHLVLAGTMTDRRAAEAVGLKPRHRRPHQSQTPCPRLARLGEIANLDPEMTRNSASVQIKALAMIVAIEGLIPDRRAGSSEKKSASQVAVPQIDAAAWLREQQGKRSPDLIRDKDGPDVPVPPPAAAAGATALSPAETTPSAPHAPVPTSVPDNPAPSSIEKPFTWRLRL